MKIGIIGAGKVGISIAHMLQGKGFLVTAVSDTQAAARETAERYLGRGPLYTENNLDVVDRADAVAVTTQDRVIGEIAAQIAAAKINLDDKLIFHTSGSDPSSVLSPLDTKGALIGSLHPLQTFPDIDSAISVLPDTCIFIEGGEGAIHGLRKLGQNIGKEVFVIDGKDKVLYHLSAVFVCNLLSALFYSGKGLMDKIGIQFEPFLPIIRATIRNIENKGPLASLTGPVVRGDAKTVKAHLAAIDDMDLHKRVYKALSEVALRMTIERGTVNEEGVAALKQALGIKEA